jgi:ADP-ribosylglycohydrolase
MNKFIKNPVLGAICGDMIGVPYEFRKSKAEENFPLWSKYSHFSDDTVMTIAVAEWLLTPPYNTNDLVKIMQKWGRKYRKAGYGHLFGKWIDSDNPQPYGSFGNGSAMRVSPVGCAFQTLETTLVIAGESAAVSHNHPEGIKGAQCVADLIFRTLQCYDLKTKEEPYKEGFLLVPSIDYKYKVDRTPQQIIKSGYKFDSTCQGSVPEAICCFAHSHSYEETIRNAIYINGDCDTQAAIAGSIAAAYWGIPKDIADEGLERLPDDLYDVLEKFSEKFGLEL